MDNNITISRINFEKLGTQYPPAENITVEKESIEKVSCYWFKKENQTKNKLIIYIHGGCFVLGSINSHKALVSHLANELNMPVCFVEYSLAPENPFPAAVNEILKVYRHIIQSKKFDDIIFMGDSAGAGLSMSVISKLNNEKISIPSHVVMISPWIDLRNNSDSISRNAAIDPVLTQESLEKFTSLYIGKTSLVKANPIEIKIEDFPPTLILVGDREILLDDSKLVYSIISKKQSNTKFKIYEGATHVWLLDDIGTEHSRDAMEEMHKFIL